MMFYHDESGRGRHQCWERMSYDNNDFCGCSHGAPVPEMYTFYAVADNQDLKKARWYRTYSWRKGSGFVDSLDNAKIWTKRRLAQAKCTNLGVGVFLVEFIAGKVNIIDQRECLAQAAEKKRLEEERRRQLAAKRELADAKRALKAVQDKVNKLRGPRKHAPDCGCKSCMGM